jgi:hypothetical protein
VIFSCSPRPEKTSNTAAIVNAFRDGYSEPAEVYYLYKRKEWDNYRKIFEENDSIIFAMPLFVECIPGLLMEFLESLTAKKDGAEKTKISFILQSGFEEACQLRTCEKYLEKLPSYLGCEYTGTLIKGGMFALAMASEKSRKKILKPFYDMGAVYALEKRFDKETVTKFAAPERYSKSVCLLIKLLSPINKIAWKFMARKFGADGKLNARPYDI